MPHDEHQHEHSSDHPHAHGHGLFDHAHAHGDDADAGAPLDPAHQSLADALRQSFRVLKGIMAILLLLYLGSGIKFLEPNEEAVVFRFGELIPAPHASGALFAWPFPVDEVVRLPVKEANELIIDSHMLWLSDEDRSKGLKFVSRGNEGLDPNRDGALLTGDRGLVHIQWVVTYKVDDLVKYLKNLSGKDMAPAVELIRSLVENAGVSVAAGMRTEEVYRERIDFVCSQVRTLVNRRLMELESGLTLTQVKAPLSIVPVQIRGAFESAQQAENQKERAVQDAQRERTRILSETAGRSFEEILKLQDQIELANAAGNPQEAGRLEARLDAMLESDVSGEAGQRIKAASAHYTTVVGRIQSDLSMYRALLPEYQRDGRLLFERLWDETRNEILNSREVTKIYRPFGLAMFRIIIGPDPRQRKLDEIEDNRLKPQPGGKPAHYEPVMDMSIQ